MVKRRKLVPTKKGRKKLAGTPQQRRKSKTQAVLVAEEEARNHGAGGVVKRRAKYHDELQEEFREKVRGKLRGKGLKKLGLEAGLYTLRWEDAIKKNSKWLKPDASLVKVETGERAYWFELKTTSNYRKRPGVVNLTKWKNLFHSSLQSVRKYLKLNKGEVVLYAKESAESEEWSSNVVKVNL